MALTNKTSRIFLWKRLQSNRCPLCNSDLAHNAGYHKCTNSKCDFTCSVQRFDQIVADLYNKRPTIGIDYDFPDDVDGKYQYLGVDFASDKPDTTIFHCLDNSIDKK